MSEATEGISEPIVLNLTIKNAIYFSLFAIFIIKHLK